MPAARVEKKYIKSNSYINFNSWTGSYWL